LSTQVLHVIARMNVGGTARYVGELVEMIPNSKLVTGNVQDSEIEDPSLERIDFIRITHLGRKISPINDILAFIKLRHIIRELQPAIVHTHTFKAGMIGRLIRGKHKRVHTFHGHLFGDQSFSALEKKAITFIEKFLASRTDLLISVGKNVGAELRAQKIGVAQNWTSIAPGVQALPVLERKQARLKLGIDDDSVLIGWMARMTEVKNPFLLLKIANELPEVNFVMAGGGNLLENIRSTAPKNVNVIGWADATTFWSAVDYAISTSDNEGMPIALIEAQMAGIPVIATNVGSNSEVIENGITGMITSNNLNDLVQAIKKVVADPSLRVSMQNNAKKRALKEFSIEKMIESHNSAYSNVLICQIGQ